MPDPGVLIAILAAGQARRFNGAKLDADCAGKPLGLWAVRAAEDAQFASRMIVIGEAQPAFTMGLEGWQLVTNHSAQTGLASSIRVAAKRAKGHSRLVVALADMPLVESELLRRLAEAEGIAFTRYPDGGRGVPAGFPARCFETLAGLDGGAAQFDWREEVALVRPASAQSLHDVDTPADLREAERLLTGSMRTASQD